MKTTVAKGVLISYELMLAILLRWHVSECVFLYSSFVQLCVQFRMAVGNQLANRVFVEKGLHI